MGTFERIRQRSTRPPAPAPPYDPFADVQKAQDLTREGVRASGELLRPEILGRIGDTLGGLNSIGALRSGGTEVALGDLSREYTDRIGQIASVATLGATGQGLQAGGLRLQREELDIERERIKAQRKASLLSAIGSVVGAGLGFAIGGPAGAAIGGKALGGVAENASSSPGSYGALYG